MELNNVGEIFLTRELYSNDDAKRKILIKIGKPEKYPESQDYYCPYQIIGLGSEKVKYAMGIDQIQAIQLTMERIGSVLYTSKEGRENSLRWIGDENGDLGFPVSSSINDLAP